MPQSERGKPINLSKVKLLSTVVLALMLTAGVSPFAVSQQSTVPSTPRFRPHYEDASLEIFDQSDQPEQLVRNAALNIDGDDEGLLASALIKSYLLDWPDSHSRANAMDEGWSIGLVMAYIDSFGLFQLRQLAVEKAIRISEMPLADLQVDGTLGVLDAAFYLEQTDRADIAEQLYRNLTRSIWPDGAPLEESRIALRAYENFLASRKQSEKDAAVQRRLDAVTTKFTPQTRQYSRHDYFKVSLDWVDAKNAYDAITKHQFADANKIIDTLVAAEKNKDSHSIASLCRLLNLARAYAKEKRTDDAQNILLRIASLTNEQHLLNLRLYLYAELFLLQNDSTLFSSAGFEKWQELQLVAKQIAKGMQAGDASSADNTPVEQLVANLLGNCATAYVLNGEPEKGLRIFQRVKTTFPFSMSTWSRNSLESKIAYCYARLGNFGESNRTLKELIKGPKEYIGREVFVHTAHIVEICTRTKHFSEGETIAYTVLGPFIEKPWVTDVHDREAMRPYDLTTVFLALGELQNAEHHFSEAEANLKTALEFGFSTPEFTCRARLALGQSLESQGEYNEAVKTYSVGQTNSGVTFPLFVNLIEASKHTKLAGSEILRKLQQMMPDVIFQHNSALRMTFQKLLSYAVEQKWDDGTIGTINELLIVTQEQDGYIKEASKARAILNDPESAFRVATFQLESGLPEKSAQTVLDALQSSYLADRLESELNLLEISSGTDSYVGKLIKCGASSIAEKILHRLIELKSEQSDFWNKKLLPEKLVLAYVYLNEGDWKAAQAISDQELVELSRRPLADSDYLQFFISRKDNFAPRSELNELLYLAKYLEEKDKIQEAIALTKRLLVAEHVWYPSGNSLIQDTYVQLAKLYHAAHSDENAKRILSTAIRLEVPGLPNRQARLAYCDLLKNKEHSRRILSAPPLPVPVFPQDLFFSIWRGHDLKLLKKDLSRELQYLTATEPRFSNNKSICMAEIACTEIALSNPDAAREWLKKAEHADIMFNTNYEMAKPLVCYAVVNYKLGQIDKAVDLAKRAVRAANGQRYSFGQHSDYNGSCAKILAGYDLETAAQKIIPRRGCTDPGPGDAQSVFFIK